MPNPSQLDTRLLMERAPAGFSLEGLDGRIRAINPALARMLGYPTPAALEGKPAEMLFAESADSQRHRAAVLASGSVTEELRLRRADGTTLWVMATSVVTGDPRTATVSARGDCQVLEIAGDVFKSYVAEHPTVIDQLADAAAARRRELEQSRGATTGGPAEARVTLAARMRRFFGL